MLRFARTQRFVSMSLLVTSLAACSSQKDQPAPDAAPAPSAPGAPQAGKPAPAAPSHTQELIQQKQQMLVKSALDNAVALREQGKYEEAREQLEAALAIDPSNTQALTSYAELQQLLGERSGDIETTRQTVERRNQAKVTAMKLEAEEYFRLGNESVGRGEFDAAIRDYERVAQSIK